jgi:hypothetical protein
LHLWFGCPVGKFGLLGNKLTLTQALLLLFRGMVGLVPGQFDGTAKQAAEKLAIFPQAPGP